MTRDFKLITPGHFYKTTQATCCIFLNNDYKGGNLLIGESKMPDFKVGDCVIFPNFVFHQVTKVTSEERFVVTGWIADPNLI